MKKLSIGRARLAVAILVAPAALFAMVAIAINVYVDPLWVLPKIGERAGTFYCVKDERQNKINRAIHGRIDNESVLIGSSRTAFLDTKFFKADNVFNMSVNGFEPAEYAPFVDRFRRYVSPPRNIYIGLDFFAYLSPGTNHANQDVARERKSVDPLYVISTLLDPEVMNSSLESVIDCSDPNYSEPTYRFDGVRHVKMRPAHVREFDNRQLKVIFDSVFSKSPVDAEFKKELLAIYSAAPGSNIVAFIPPISDRLLMAAMSTGRFDQYVDWLKIVTDVFGKVRYFSGLNSFTRDASNFLDTHHVYPARWPPLVAMIEGGAPHEDGLGEILTPEKLPAFVQRLHAAVCAESNARDGAPYTIVPGC